MAGAQAQTRLVPATPVRTVQPDNPGQHQLTPPAQGQGIQQLRHFAASTKAAAGRFVQTPLGGGQGTQGRASGSFAFARPGRFRWAIEKPDPQLIVTDGQKLYFYDEGLKQVTIRAADQAIQATPAAVLFGVGDLDSTFRLAEAQPYAGLAWVEAVPKSPDSGFERIRIGMRDGLPRIMEVVDAFGQVNRFEFSQLRTDGQLPAGLFQFQVPAGVDVLQ